MTLSASLSRRIALLTLANAALMPAAGFRKCIQDETTKFAEVIKTNHITLD